MFHSHFTVSINAQRAAIPGPANRPDGLREALKPHPSFFFPFQTHFSLMWTLSFLAGFAHQGDDFVLGNFQVSLFPPISYSQ
jgi:hypothetical protein